MSQRYPVPIETQRLILRPLMAGDGAMLYDAKRETEETLSKVFEWASHGFDLEADHAYVAKSQAEFENGEDLSLVGYDRETNKPVIFTGLHDAWGKPGTFQIGFWVRQSAQDQRLAEESSNALIRYAFTQLGAEKIVMCHSAQNVKSPKIFKALGFEFDEVREKSLRMAGGNVVDAYWYKMTSPDKLKPMDVRWG
jgi:RimJ/RimL family protein N-acetyltransferase